MFDDFDFGQSDDYENDYEYQDPMNFMIGTMSLVQTLQQLRKNRLEKERKMRQNESQNNE